MFFGKDGEEERPIGMTIGPLKFTVNQLYISVVTILIATVPHLMIITLFKKARVKLSKSDYHRYKTPHPKQQQQPTSKGDILVSADQYPTYSRSDSDLHIGVDVDVDIERSPCEECNDTKVKTETGLRSTPFGTREAIGESSCDNRAGQGDNSFILLHEIFVIWNRLTKAAGTSNI